MVMMDLGNDGIKINSIRLRCSNLDLLSLHKMWSR